MAFIRDYELPGTGLTVQNAYHVITNVAVEKRTQDVPAPYDVTRPNGLTAGTRDPAKAVYWKAGYIGTVSLTVWKDEQSRIQGLQPLGFIGVNPTDNKYGASIGTPGLDHICKFFIDVSSEKNYVEQAYDHLKTTTYYLNASIV